MEEVILTPIYKGIDYQYHECSNCKGQINFEESYIVPFKFEEKMKYCPLCGGQIIRYSKPKYIEEINWDWLEEYQKIMNRCYDFLTYKIHCKMNNEQRNELEEKAEYGQEYFGTGDSYYFISKGDTCKILYNICRQKLHYTNKNKLEQEFKGGTKE